MFSIYNLFLHLLLAVTHCASLKLNRIRNYERLYYSPLDLPTSHIDHFHNGFFNNSAIYHLSPLYLNFFAFRRNFSLILHPDLNILSPDAVLEMTNRPKTRLSTIVRPYKGVMTTHPESQVFGGIVNGHFRGTISPYGPHSQQGSFHIEPAHNFFHSKNDFHSIIYHDDHVIWPFSEEDNQFGQHKRHRRETNANLFDNHPFCGWSNPNIAEKLNHFHSSPVNEQPNHAFRKKRDTAVYHSSSRQFSPDQYNFYPSLLRDPKNKADNEKNGDLFYDNAIPRYSASYDSRVCNLFLQSDTYLWNYVMSMTSVQHDAELAIKEITTIFIQHVQAAMSIFQRTDFSTFDRKISYPGVSFRVDRVRINQTGIDCPPNTAYGPIQDTDSGKPSEKSKSSSNFLFASTESKKSNEGVHVNGNANQPNRPGADDMSQYSIELRERWNSNPFCLPNIDVTNFLNLNSYTNHSMFCLAYVFTYRDFSGGTLGLAWVAEPGGSGGVCEWYRPMREGSHTNVHKSLNTGIVTLLNYGSRVASKVSQLTFAHEMGHNFGSKHDDDHKGVRDGVCLPPENSPHGNYIMFASATSGDKENNNKFSICSRDSIARLLDLVLKRRDHACFKTKDGAFCGNKLTEIDEECDCGYDSQDCQDRCCNPRENQEGKACKLKKDILINGIQKKVRCSPTAGECCTHDCQIRNSSILCRSKSDCYEAAHCDGVASICPNSPHFPDLTPCQDHTRVCKGGECIGSICERLPGWKECSLPRSEKITPEMMCYVACQPNNTDSSGCISTYDLERDKKLQAKYPTLSAELLLSDGKGIQLKAGAPCDSYRGYCDVFRRCRSVDAEGPLARLRSLIFSPQMLRTLQDWVISHWWAIILISLGVIVFLVVFVKVCSVHTPSTNPNRPAARPFTLRRNHHNNSGIPAPGPSSGNRNSQRYDGVGSRGASSRPLTGGSGATSIHPPSVPPSSHRRSGGGSGNSRRTTTDEVGILLTNMPGSSQSDAPPPYTAVAFHEPPPQHGKGRGKTGHRDALNQMAAKFKV